MAPYEIAALLGSFIGAAAWAGHTAASKDFAADIEAAIRDAVMTKKELAYEMGITPEKFSRQLAGLEPLSAWRLYGLTSPDFRLYLLDRQAARLGASVITHAHIGTLIAKVEELTATKRMAKADLQPLSQKEAC